jgi:hypothetical protein
MLPALSSSGATKAPSFHAAPAGDNHRAAASPWARSDSNDGDRAVAAPPADGVVYPRISDQDHMRMMHWLSPAEQARAGRIAQSMTPRRHASPHFDSTVPSHGVGPSTGTHYSVTCCPTDTPNHQGKRFGVDHLMHQAFRSNARTIISLTSQGDFRHSEYYKNNKRGGAYDISSSGQPAFTHQVRNADGTPATISVFNNSVRDNRTGETRQVKMVHVNGWRDQTALSSDAQMSMIRKLKDHLSPADLRSVVAHCSEGRNRTGSFVSTMEGMDAAAKGRPANIPGMVQWFRNMRVPDAVFVPQQLAAMGEIEVRLDRLGGGQQQQQRQQPWLQRPQGGMQWPQQHQRHPHRAFG